MPISPVSRQAGALFDQSGGHRRTHVERGVAPPPAVMAASTAMLPVPDRTRASTNEAGAARTDRQRPDHADVDNDHPDTAWRARTLMAAPPRRSWRPSGPVTSDGHGVTPSATTP